MFFEAVPKVGDARCGSRTCGAVAPQSKAALAALRASHGPRSSGTIFGDEQKSSFRGKEPLGQRKSLPLCADVGERFGQAVNTQQKQIYGHDNV